MNIGDSGIMVVRKGCVPFHSPVQQHFFNCPYQLGSDPNSDPPSLAEVSCSQDNFTIVFCVYVFLFYYFLWMCVCLCVYVCELLYTLIAGATKMKGKNYNTKKESKLAPSSGPL